MSDADDRRLIWSLATGCKLVARRDLHEDLDESLPRWFTAGSEYRVESMQPISDPPFVKVRCDDGSTTKLMAGHIRADFKTPNASLTGGCAAQEKPDGC